MAEIPDMLQKAGEIFQKSPEDTNRKRKGSRESPSGLENSKEAFSSLPPLGELASTARPGPAPKALGLGFRV